MSARSPHATLACAALTIHVPGRTLIRGLDLELHAGHLVVVLGRNGVGKSSLLHALAGLNARATGTVTVDGAALPRWSRRELARRVALLPQASEDPFPGSVLDSVLVGRHPHIDFWRWEDARDRDVARRALEETDLSGFDDRDVGTLSGGERRRLSVATVLAQEPQIYLLDEPVQQLDPHHQIEVLRLFRAEADGGRLVVMSLHDVGLAARFADEAVLLHGDGRWRHGDAGHVLDASTLGELYGMPLEELQWSGGRTFVPA